MNTTTDRAERICTCVVEVTYHHMTEASVRACRSRCSRAVYRAPPLQAPKETTAASVSWLCHITLPVYTNSTARLDNRHSMLNIMAVRTDQCSVARFHFVAAVRWSSLLHHFDLLNPLLSYSCYNSVTHSHILLCTLTSAPIGCLHC